MQKLTRLIATSKVPRLISRVCGHNGLIVEATRDGVRLAATGVVGIIGLLLALALLADFI